MGNCPDLFLCGTSAAHLGLMSGHLSREGFGKLGLLDFTVEEFQFQGPGVRICYQSFLGPYFWEVSLEVGLEVSFEVGL